MKETGGRITRRYVGLGALLVPDSLELRGLEKGLMSTKLSKMGKLRWLNASR